MEKTINRRSFMEANTLEYIKKSWKMHKYSQVAIMVVAFLVIFVMFIINSPSIKPTLLNYKVFANDQKISKSVQGMEPVPPALVQRQSSYAYSEEQAEINDSIDSNQKNGEESSANAKSEPTAENIVDLSEKDLEALYRIVEAEATQEDIIGRVLIANVIFNRMESDGFPDTAYEVIHQKIRGRAQFSPIDDKRYYTVKVSEKTKEAVERALKGEDYSKGALFFVARSMASRKAVSWFDKNLTKVYEHGVHEFFTY